MKRIWLLFIGCWLFVYGSAQTIQWASFKKGRPWDTLSLLERDILVNANKYAVTTWWNTVKGYGKQEGRYLDWGGNGEHNIRAGGSEAFALAVALRTGVYDPIKTGVSTDDATDITLKLIRSGAYRHKANTSDASGHTANISPGWGDAWQSALWAAYTGAAGWMMWDKLDEEDRHLLEKMVTYEADRFLNYSVPYYKDRDGNIMFKGDSKAEENAWNAMILQVAMVMMPENPHWAGWMNKNIELELSACARPEDVHSTAVIDGRRLGEVLGGSNYNSDGTVINHGITHPDYMVCNSLFNALLFMMAGRPVPAAAFYNEDIIYKRLDSLIYKPATADVHYPSPNDWGRERKMHFALLDCQAHAFGLDSLSQRKGDYWEALHAAHVLRMQQRNQDGRTYQGQEEDNYKGREEWVAMHAAQAWLTKWLVWQGRLIPSNTSSALPTGSPIRSEVGDGWAKNSINTVIFRHNSLVTYNDTQYIAYYDPGQHVVLGRRPSGSSHWETRVTQYKGDATDAHRSISIMVDGDGFLHVSWNHHNNALHYCRSVSPGSLELTAEMPMTGKKETRVSYPEFYRLASGNLLFLYRDGSSGNGDLMLDHYDWKTQQWTQVQDGWINGEGERNAYWQMVTDKKGVIHLSWVWRETGDVATNHDICYARSKDEGKTWEKSTGEAYRLPITAATAEYACRIPQNSELINTTSMAADEKGRPYIATYWRLPDEKVPQYRIVYQDKGKWQVRQVSARTTAFSLSGGGTKRIPISRPVMMVNRRGKKTRVLMIFRDEERGDRVSVAVNKDLRQGNWRIEDLTSTSVGLWEPSYDTELWKQKGTLDLFVQKVEQGDGEKLKELPPQPVEVLEWQPDWK